MCHSYSLFPFYTPLSLPSLLSFSYVPALFFSLSLRYANCARNASRLSTNCKWQGLIRFVSQCLGHFTLPTSVTRCVRVWNFLYSLFCLFFFTFYLSLSLSFFSFSHYAFGCVDTLCSFDGTSDHFSRPDAWHFISFFVACVRSHPVCSFFSGPSRYLSSEVRCASLRIVMPPLLNRPSVGYVLRVQCVFDVETQVVTMVSFCCYFAIDVLWHSATRNRFAVSSKEGACTRCQKEPFFLSTHRVIAPH